jgi:hypothetical protein
MMAAIGWATPSLHGQSAPGLEELNRITLVGTVMAVDLERRTLTMQGGNGQVVTLDIPPNVGGLEQVKLGDNVLTVYSDRVKVRLKPDGEPPVDRWIEPSVTPRSGDLPGATVVRQREATATVTAWNPATRTVVFTGPQGVSYSRTVSMTTAAATLDGIRPGARADITWTEALEVSVQPATAVGSNQLPIGERGFNPTQEVAGERPEGPAVMAGPAELRFGGYLGVVGIFRDVNGGGGTGTSFASIPYRDTLQGNVSESRLTAQPSRLSIRADANVTEGQARFRRLSGYIEMDFNGNVPGTAGVSTTSVGLRLRHGFGEAQYRDSWFLAVGQTFTLMTPQKSQLSSWPSDVEMSQAVDTNYLAGMMWGRIPGVRVTWRPSRRFNWAFAAENPEQELGTDLVKLPACCSSDIGAQYNTGSEGLRVPNFMPDLHSRVAFNGNDDGWHVDVGGVFRVFRHELQPYDTGNDQRQAAGGVSANASARLSAGTKILGQFSSGSGMGRYIGGLVPDAAFTPEGGIEPIRTRSWVVGVEQALRGAVSLAGYFSGVESDARTFVDRGGAYIGFGYPGSPNSNNDSIREATVTFGWRTFQSANRGSVQLSTQLSWLDRKPFDPGTGPPSAEMFMLQVQLRYNLP